MIREKDLAVARELKERISRIIPLLDIRVFGSRARGDADEYSDLDVFLEVESLDRDIEELISDIAWEVGFAHHLVISPLVFSRDEIENGPLKVSPIVQSITDEGVRI